MKCFSDKHKSHVLSPGSYTSHLLRNFQDTSGVGFNPWSQTYLESVVSLLYFSRWKLFLWFANRFLKFVSVHPMYSALLPFL